MLRQSRGQTELSYKAGLAWHGERNTLAKKYAATGRLNKRGIWEHILKTNPIVFIGYQSMVATLQSADWRVEARGAPKRVVRFLEDAFFSYLLTNFKALIGKILLAPGYGSAPFELVFQDIGRYWYPRKIEYRPVRSFDLDSLWRDRDGWYYGQHSYYDGQGGRYKTVEYGRGSGKPWLWWVKYGDTMMGTPILRSILTEHATKEDVRRILAIAVQKNLLPPPAVYLKSDYKQPREGDPAYEEYREMLDEIGATIYHEEGVMGLPEYVDRVEPLAPNPDSLTGAIQTMNALDIQILLAFGAHWMARGVLAQFGSNAAAQVDVSEQRNVRQHYLNWASAQFDWLIRLLVDINFGEQLVYPALKAIYRPVLETKEKYGIINKTRAAGNLSWTDADEDRARTELELPPRTVDSDDQPRKASKPAPETPGAVTEIGDTRERPSGAESEQ